MNDLIKKYINVLQLLNIKSDLILHALAKTIDTSVIYLKDYYGSESKQTKAASVFVVKELFLQKDTINNEVIEKIIDDFIIYNKGYQDYLNTLVLITDQFDADLTFYKIFIKNYFN